MTGLGRNHHNQVLGVMVDGRELKLALLGRQGGELVIHALESATLNHRLGKMTTHKTTAPAAQEEPGKDIFGLEDASDYSTEDIVEAKPEDGDVSSLLVNLFAKYLLKKTSIAVNIPEGQTTYYGFENDFGLKGKKLVQRLREEISPLAGGSLDMALLDHFRAETGALAKPPR